VLAEKKLGYKQGKAKSGIISQQDKFAQKNSGTAGSANENTFGHSRVSARQKKIQAQQGSFMRTKKNSCTAGSRFPIATSPAAP